MEEDKNISTVNSNLSFPISLEEKIREKTAIIGVIGLGSIGLSLGDAFAKINYRLRGYDKEPLRISALQEGKNPHANFPLPHFFRSLKSGRIKISDSEAILADADILIISVPTSLNKNGDPELSCLRAAFQTVCKNIQGEQLIIVQSTTYPGCSEGELLPLLVDKGLLPGKDFYLAHVPETVDIGNLRYSFDEIPRIVGGQTERCLQIASLLYERIGCTVVPCSSPSVAEAAKLLQNSYRLVNISLVNELKVLFDRMGIDIWEVVAAASSKPFGFFPFYPSAGIGGDCIPVDPVYLRWKAEETKGAATLIDSAIRVNNNMADYVVQKVIEALNEECRSLKGSSILLLGAAYKRDVEIVRNSPAAEIIQRMERLGALVSYHDPFVPDYRVEGELLHSIEFTYEGLPEYDCVLILVDHSWYDFEKIAEKSRTIVDTRNATENFYKRGIVIKA